MDFVKDDLWEGGAYLAWRRATGTTETGETAEIPWDVAGFASRFAIASTEDRGRFTASITKEMYDAQSNRDLDIAGWLERVRTGGNLLSIHAGRRACHRHLNLASMKAIL